MNATSKTADHLDDLVTQAARRLEVLEEGAFSVRSQPGAWSARELIGHLIDSASNNHQRFVRAAFVDHLDFPGYQQDDWVELQRYDKAPAGELITLWSTFNRQLAHLIRGLSEEALSRPRPDHALDKIAFSPFPANEPATLAWFIADYVVHLEHHLQQLGNLLGIDLNPGVN